MTAWFYPPSGQTARSVSMTPFNGGIAVADWTTPQFFPFSNGALGNAIVLAPGTPGLSAVASDGANGLWALSYSGTIWHYPPSGNYDIKSTLASGNVYIGVTGSGYALSSNGFVWGSSSGTVTGAVDPWSTAFSNAFGGGQLVPPISGLVGLWPSACVGLATSGTTLMTILPASGVGTMSYTGTTGLISFPTAMTTGSCIAAQFGSNLAVGGWALASPLSGAAAAVGDPQNIENVLAVGSGHALLWTNANPIGENWAQSGILSGLANLNNMAWVPNGIQVLATAVSTNALQVIGFSANVLSLSQTLTISGACSVAVAPTSTNALVAQSGQSQLTVLVATNGTWSIQSSLSGMPGITSVVTYGASGAVAAYTNTLAFLGLNNNAWSVINTVALNFTPTVLTADVYGTVYAAGVNHLAVANGTTVTATGVFTGTPTGIAIQQGRLVIAAPGNGLFVFGNTAASTWSQQFSASLSLGAAVNLALSETVLFVMGSGATNTYGFSGSQYELTPVISGVCSQWNGSSWTVTPLGIGHNPSALAFDTSGQIQLTTIQNDWYTISAGGSVTSISVVPQISAQLQTVPIGPSCVLAMGSGLYTTTSLGGSLVELI